ncbi:T9SS type A sorting domain-containing protein [Psychroserpens sp. SPM9]|uniref:T9SS type A sorting domain-containing protein n=1 Tax=Psychroserpens sp. SPM9 TaxID=2975598 RepID=UPI0021A82D3D|nr:T9SS type A sorting domain-containing protein [Psychroserpens sp. SPM9]MDG5491225.1 T9SS type A sorting domain-containing protein [Psychroserpens sp. SPM9]
MKQFYLLFVVIFSAFSVNSQNYEFGIVHNQDYTFSVVAVPDFDATDTDISDIGFALMLPAGNADIENVSPFNSRVWSATEVTAEQLTTFGLGDGTRDGFVMNLPPGQTILSHVSGEPFVLVTFDVSNTPTTGSLELLTNSDPIAIGLGGAVDSFYNSNIDGTTTQDYFGGFITGMESIMFDTLSTLEVIIDDSVSVYPNPASDIIYIKTLNTIESLQLFDILGKRVVNSKNENEIKVSDYQSGVYVLKVKTNKGQVIKRIVID